MQLYVRHRLDEPLEIPVNHNQILQAVIYASLGGASYKHYMHDQGFSYKNRNYSVGVVSHKRSSQIALY